MLLKDFYIHVIALEAKCVDFLQEHLLLGDVADHDPCQKCGSEMSMFIIELPLVQTASLTGKSVTTVTDCYNICLEVCTAVIGN